MYGTLRGSVRTTGTTDNYTASGLVGSSVEVGVIEFSVPLDAPSILYYVSDKDVNLGGVFEVLESGIRNSNNLWKFVPSSKISGSGCS